MAKKAQTTKKQKPDAPLVQADDIDEVNVDATIVNNNGKNNQTTVNNVDVEVNDGDDEKEDDNPLINPVPQPIPIAKEDLTVLAEAQEDAQAEEDHVNTGYRKADKTDEDVQKKRKWSESYNHLDPIEGEIIDKNI